MEHMRFLKCHGRVMACAPKYCNRMLKKILTIVVWLWTNGERQSCHIYLQKRNIVQNMAIVTVICAFPSRLSPAIDQPRIDTQVPNKSEMRFKPVYFSPSNFVMKDLQRLIYKWHMCLKSSIITYCLIVQLYSWS